MSPLREEPLTEYEGKALPPGWRLVVLSEVDSTNDEIKRRDASDPGEGLVVTAAAQTAGRGRRGRSWSSPRGNLYVSFRLALAEDLAATARLSFVAAVALAEALEAAAPHLRVRLKWPNDVLVNGGKVSGILLETHDNAVILGVGVNVVSAPEAASTLYAATSLRAEGSDVSRETLLPLFIERLHACIGIWRRDGFGPIRRAWMDRAQGLGEPVVARLQTGEEVHGTFVDLDADGALVVEGAYGRRRILAADVYFPDPTAPAGP